jgi:uncharacterized protein (DUF2384 family)
MRNWHDEVTATAVKVLGRDSGMQWVLRPNRKLDGMRPVDLCGDEYGARVVLAALEQRVAV